MMAVLPPMVLIETAFKRFENSVTLVDARYFHSTELRHVRQAAIEIENWQRQRGSLRNMRRIEPFLKAIEKYSKPMDVLCNGTPFLPWVWVSITASELSIWLKLGGPAGSCQINASGESKQSSIEARVP